MNTLTIKDLARTEQLDHSAMAGVRGGWKMGGTSFPSYGYSDVKYAPSYDKSIHADQSLLQMQDVTNATANGSAFLSSVHANNSTSQNGSNNIFA